MTITATDLHAAAVAVAGQTTNARCDEHADIDCDDPQGSDAAMDCEVCVRYTRHVIELGLSALGLMSN